jgi:hypothetical protein
MSFFVAGDVAMTWPPVDLGVVLLQAAVPNQVVESSHHLMGALTSLAGNGSQRCSALLRSTLNICCFPVPDDSLPIRI